MNSMEMFENIKSSKALNISGVLGGTEIMSSGQNLEIPQAQMFDIIPSADTTPDNMMYKTLS